MWLLSCPVFESTKVSAWYRVPDVKSLRQSENFSHDLSGGFRRCARRARDAIADDDIALLTAVQEVHELHNGSTVFGISFAIVHLFVTSSTVDQVCMQPSANLQHRYSVHVSHRNSVRTISSFEGHSMRRESSTIVISSSFGGVVKSTVQELKYCYINLKCRRLILCPVDSSQDNGKRNEAHSIYVKLAGKVAITVHINVTERFRIPRAKRYQARIPMPATN